MEESNSYSSEITIENFNDLHEIIFVKKNAVYVFLFHLFGILTCGLVYLFFYWKPLNYLLYQKTRYFIQASHVIIICNNGDKIISIIKEKKLMLNPFDESIEIEQKYFEFAKSKYVYEPAKKHFSSLETRFARSLEEREIFDLNSEVSKLGISWENIEKLQETFGKNNFTIDQSSVVFLIFKGFIHPFSIILIFFTVICFISYKMAQSIMYGFYVILIIVFDIIKTKSKEGKIIELSLKETNVKIFRRNSSEGKFYTNFFFQNKILKKIKISYFSNLILRIILSKSEKK